ncbi:MAG: FAD-dependent oxidoreductase [Deltaproteobacteria bacterium]|nr:FAD-dependent oxidoreductase [Deltaproteobacteria bacterium]MBW2052815.1 FAD-dependent oxidoreductase [Deltaproteobacteria bacterium]
MTSIEGKRGMPRTRPPFPAIQGLWKKPTILNNVETLASIPQIILNGGEAYSGLGTSRSKGTKVFALTGDVNNVGLVEVPMGMPIGTIVYDIGGGIPKGKQFKAIQLGGPSGGCIPKQHLNTPVDYESITELGAIVGSGGMIVMNEDACMVDMARFFMEFCVEESCGKCAPCRVGTRKMLDILTRICEGEGREGDIETLERWADIVKNTALCGLGQTAPNPVLSTLRYFRDEYEAHIKEKRCPAVVCSDLFKAPCQHACPAEMDVASYVALVRAERFDDAYKVLLKSNPFPSVCGRVCNHRCETKCRRATLDEPISIKNLKRFITDSGQRPQIEKVPVTREEKIAVIGAGPSGITAARELALRGYAVTVFESLPEAGGMLRWGIPAYRLPRDILQGEIDNVVALGVELRCGARVGEDISWDTIKKDFDCIYMATGAQRSEALGAEGENLKGVDGAVEFLRDVNLGTKTSVGKRVAVIGGGNSAIDAARCALRLGAEDVTILYRRFRTDMPAQEEEIIAAEEEGVKIEYLVNPLRFLGDDGHVRKVICQRMSPGEFDSSGRRKPIPIEEDFLALDVDQVVIAIGQATDLSFASLNGDINVSRRGLIEIQEGTRTRAGEAMIFAGGDVVTGPETVIGAIAAGRKAAAEIDSAIRSLNGEPEFIPPLEPEIEIPVIYDEDIQEKAREVMSEVPTQERIKDFREVEIGFTKEAALAEACRCLRCDLTIEE